MLFKILIQLILLPVFAINFKFSIDHFKLGNYFFAGLCIFSCIILISALKDLKDLKL